MKRALFAIFGNPVAHSKSPQMHNFAFRALKEEACYTRRVLEDGSALRSVFEELKLDGANVTVPHKEAALYACDEADSFATEVKAVNTLVLKEGKLLGYNTDAPGFLKALAPFKEIQSVLLLGAGGTARAIAPLLKKSGYSVTLYNRSKERLAHFQARGFATSTYDKAQDLSFDLVVNTTSAGLSDTALPAPKLLLERIIKEAKGAVEVIYGKQTSFLQLATKYKVQSIDGSEMLLQQGVLAFDLFTNHRYKLETIEAVMRQGLHL